MELLEGMMVLEEMELLKKVKDYWKSLEKDVSEKQGKDYWKNLEKDVSERQEKND